jgi:hypothetical protein
MSTVIAILLVLALLIGITSTLRTTARSGMPSKEVLDRARKRSQEMEAHEREKAERGD